ncbi:SAM-dependent methyltransferase [Nocardia yunnanensis]|uniref:S-adenosyl-L-methionine-dependent methyltransferase n=1 Tax=Nocardia yunnanensis TaxID=2382165 RepID=A0A386ZDD0_9NOCA|nr:class I SAM-dependent methyltransferase [Nocardia yunnanensis]AYF75872.1 SAM-dependent methyltransferase [Nocardia yunnanensis]
MRVGQLSRTALGAARARALHQTSDEPRIFTDPVAVALAGAVDDAAGEVSAGKDVPDEARLFLAMRHRFAEDALAARAGEFGQVVVLGAGLDTFGVRNPYPHLTVYEVDHPDTQAWKRGRLAHAGIAVPDGLRFVACDFENDDLASELRAQGFDATIPTFFIWLGVVQYLTGEAVDATLSFIAELPAPAQVVIDYSEPPSALPPQRRAVVEMLSTIMAGIGEPWLSLFTRDEIADKLTGFGYSEVEDLDWTAMLARYAPASTAADQVGGHVLRAAHAGRAARATAP